MIGYKSALNLQGLCSVYCFWVSLSFSSWIPLQISKTLGAFNFESSFVIFSYLIFKNQNMQVFTLVFTLVFTCEISHVIVLVNIRKHFNINEGDPCHLWLFYKCRFIKTISILSNILRTKSRDMFCFGINWMFWFRCHNEWD